MTRTLGLAAGFGASVAHSAAGGVRRRANSRGGNVFTGGVVRRAPECSRPRPGCQVLKCLPGDVRFGFAGVESSSVLVFSRRAKSMSLSVVWLRFSSPARLHSPWQLCGVACCRSIGRDASDGAPQLFNKVSHARARNPTNGTRSIPAPMPSSAMPDLPVFRQRPRPLVLVPGQTNEAVVGELCSAAGVKTQ